MKISVPNAPQVAKRILWLAYQASAPMGMGHLHFTDKATEEDVFKEVYHPADKYSSESLYADYLLGRTMRLYMRYTENEIDFGVVTAPRQDYQSWCRRYPTYERLIQAAIMSLTA